MARKKTKNVEFREEDILSHELTSGNPTFKIKPLSFKSKKQKDFFDLCHNDDMKLVICDGPAGSGKSLIALYAALKSLKSGKYDRIMYIRSPVDSSEKGIGFLPGDIHDKIINYMVPLDEKISKLVYEQDTKKLFDSGMIEYNVNSFMRGRSIENAIIIVDEIQNFTMKEALSLFSRTEETTKIIAIGDHMQSDIGLKSCLTKIMTMFEGDIARENGVDTFKFNNEDIVRSKLTRYIVGVFEHHMKISRGNAE